MLGRTKNLQTERASKCALLFIEMRLGLFMSIPLILAIPYLNLIYFLLPMPACTSNT